METCVEADVLQESNNATTSNETRFKADERQKSLQQTSFRFRYEVSERRCLTQVAEHSCEIVQVLLMLVEVNLRECGDETVEDVLVDLQQRLHDFINKCLGPTDVGEDREHGIR